ncbi:MAG TPA: hypothetical protein VHW02_00065 [Rhizomicrobium sp.]|nr:hypothetical protein [Rhizomicrobium sp.]
MPAETLNATPVPRAIYEFLTLDFEIEGGKNGSAGTAMRRHLLPRGGKICREGGKNLPGQKENGADCSAPSAGFTTAVSG